MLIRSLTRRAIRERPDRELIRDQLADRPDPPVAEVIDVVGVAAPVVQIDQVADDRDEVLFGEDGVVRVDLQAEPVVDLVPADPPEIVPLRVEEQPLELGPGGVEIRRVAGPQQRVDLLQRLGLAGRRILEQRVLDQRRLRPPRRQQHLDPHGAGREELLAQRVVHLSAALGQDLAGLRIGHVERQHRDVALTRRRSAARRRGGRGWYTRRTPGLP